MHFEQRETSRPKTGTPDPLLETDLHGADDVGVRNAEWGRLSPAATSLPSSSESCQTPTSEDIILDVQDELSPAMLKKATSSILEQVDWWKVVVDAGGEGIAMTYRDTFKDILESKIERLRFREEAYSGRNRAGESESEDSFDSSFIDDDSDDSFSGNYREDGSKETDEEYSDQDGLYGDESGEDNVKELDHDKEDVEVSQIAGYL